MEQIQTIQSSLSTFVFLIILHPCSIRLYRKRDITYTCMFAFPGCSKYFITDRILFFKPHNSPAELELLMPLI